MKRARLFTLLVPLLLVAIAAIAASPREEANVIKRVNSWTNTAPIVTSPALTVSPSLSALLPPAVPPKMQAVFVVVTAWNGQDSPQSKPELAAVATNNQIGIGWTGVNGAGVVNYRASYGTNSGNYQWFQDAGTNLSMLITQVVPLAPAAPVSNFYRVYPQVSAYPTGSFSFLPGSPYFVFTNTGGVQRFIRVLGVATNVP